MSPIVSWPAEILPPDGPSLKFISRSFLDPTCEYLVERETYYNSDFTAEQQQYQKSMEIWSQKLCYEAHHPYTRISTSPANNLKKISTSVKH